MAEYVLVTDSTADVPGDILAQLGVEVIPMEFLMDDEVYHHYSDAREMSFHEFYRRLKDGAKVRTSQINAYTYEQVLTPILEQGKDILYLCFTSGLSGTYDASRMAVESLKQKFPDRKIVTIDTLCASIGEGLIAYLAGCMKQNGMGMDELEAWVNENRTNICHWFVVEDLEHLHQGGRISAGAALIGTALGVKPLLSVDEKGKLVTVAKLRGSKKILETFCKKLTEDAFDPAEQTVVIGHAEAPEKAQKIEAALLERGLVKKAIITDIGPIIGTHVGPGMCALAFLGKRNLHLN